MSRQPPPPPGGPFGSVGEYPQEPPQPRIHDLAKPAYHASTYEFGSSPDADNVLAATPVPRASRIALRINLLGLLAALLIGVSGFVSWTAGLLAHDPAAKPADLALRWLWSLDAVPTDSPKLIVALLIAAAATLLGALLASSRWLLLIGGVAAIIASGLHLRQLRALNLDPETNFVTLAGAGAWVCLAGGILAVVARLLDRQNR